MLGSRHPPRSRDRAGARCAHPLLARRAALAAARSRDRTRPHADINARKHHRSARRVCLFGGRSLSRLGSPPMLIRPHYALLPEDERETWTREQLEAMDARFSAALEEAFRLGLESRESAAGQVKLPVSLGPRWVTPLTREIREGLWRSSAANALVFVAR